MRIDSIKITRFRGIREGEINGLVDVNVLIGRNNSGKSSVLEAITWVASNVGVRPSLRERMHEWSRARGEDKRALPRDELSYRGQGGIDVQLATNLGSVRPGHALPNETRAPLAELDTFHRRDLENQELDSKLWEQHIRPTRRDKLLRESLNTIFQTTIEELELPPSGRLTLAFPDHALSLDVQGDGVRAAFRCLLLLTAMQDTALLIEEPESHQHPGALRRFATALCAQAKKQNVQLFVTTHSRECIDAFLEAADAAKSAAAVFHLRLDEGGTLHARKLDKQAAEGLEQSGLDLRELDLYG